MNKVCLQAGGECCSVSAEVGAAVSSCPLLGTEGELLGDRASVPTGTFTSLMFLLAALLWF